MNKNNSDQPTHAAHVSAEAILKHMTKGLNKQEAARFRSYRLQLHHNIKLTPKQEEDFSRLKILITNNLRRCK